jgi:dipeptidyl aminopeptidase/acylaminoacyl peptidase
VNERRKALTAAVAAILVSILAAVVVGCGGGASQPVSSDEAGTLVIRIDSPAALNQGRYIPPEAKSIKAFVFAEGNLTTVQASGFVNLPESSITVSNVPVGPKDIRLTAYDGLGGAGTWMASGVCQATVQWGQDNLGHAYLEASRLIFASNRDDVNLELYRATPDGRYTSRITTNNYADEDPAPSPDGKKIAFAAFPSYWEIRLYDVASSSITTFANPTGNNLYPAWSPDSKKIAWINSNGGTYTLEIKNADGSGGMSSLSLGTFIPSRPAWSPDGTRIAFEQSSPTDSEIKMVRSDLTGSVWNVTDDSIDESTPVWSHDGSTIYCSAADGMGYYQLASLDGSSGFWPGNTYSPEFLANEPWNHYLGGTSPDGNLLTYYGNSWEAGNHELYYLDIGPGAPAIGDSRQSIRVTYNSAQDVQPVFLPPSTASGSVGGG